jgi:Icc-related predicted phosphoesterase
MNPKLLACGDLHVEDDLLKSTLLVAKQERVNLLIFVGDFCDGRKLSADGSITDFLNQAEPTVEILKNSEIPIFFVLGNHDPVEFSAVLSESPLITDLHGVNVQWNNFTFGGIGGSHMVTPQLLNLTLPFLEEPFLRKLTGQNLNS